MKLFAYMLIAILVTPALVAAQDAKLNNLPPPVKVTIEPREDGVAAAEKVKVQFEGVQDRLRDNYMSASAKLDGMNEKDKAAAIDRLNAIVKELQRLSAAMEKYAKAVKEDKPASNIAQNLDPKAYTDEKGNPDKELLNQVLQLAAAGVCVWAPPYCPLAMAIAKLLGLNLDEIKKATQVLDAVHSHAAGDPLSKDQLRLIQTVTGLPPEAVQAIGNWKPGMGDVPQDILQAVNALSREKQIRSADRELGEKGKQLVTHLLDGKLAPKDAFERTYGSTFDSAETKMRVVAYLKSVSAGRVGEYIAHAQGMKSN